MTYTDQEILDKADEIRARQARAAKGRKIMASIYVEILGWDDGGPAARIEVPRDAELAAFLCRLLDCNITEGGEG